MKTVWRYFTGKPTITSPLDALDRQSTGGTVPDEPDLTELLAELDAKITRLEHDYGMTRQEATP